MKKAVLVGNLTRTPESRAAKEHTIVTFSIAVNGYKKGDVHYFDIEAWNKLGENVAKFCDKGSKVSISGDLMQSRWEDKASGKTRSKVYVKAQEVNFLSSKADNAPADEAPANDSSGAANDLPF